MITFLLLNVTFIKIKSIRLLSDKRWGSEKEKIRKRGGKEKVLLSEIKKIFRIILKFLDI